MLDAAVNTLLTKSSEQGLGFLMFAVLLLYVLWKQDKRDKKSEDRETKYQEIIQELTKKFDIIELIRTDVKEVKDYIFKK